MSRATPTATSSSAPCVIAMRDRRDGGDRDDPPGRLERQVARGDRQPRLVEAVDLDVLDLVDPGDEDVHAQARQQRPQQVDRVRGAVQRRGDHVEADDRQRRADQRVRAPEAPQHAQRPRRRSRGRPSHRDRGATHRAEATRPCNHAAPMLAAYRATGADPPFGDPRGYHAAGLEGHFWRITQPRTGAVVVVILAICRDAQGHPWAMASLAAHPGGAVRSATLPDAWGAPRGLALRAGDAFAADERSLRVDLGPDARLERELRRAAGVAAAGVRRARARAGRPRPEPVLASVAAARAGERQRARRRARRSTSTAPSPTPRRTGARAACRPRGGGGRRTASIAPTCASPSPAVAPGSGRCARRRRRWSSPSATRCAPSCGRCARCASPSTSAAGAWPARGSRSRPTPTARPHLLPVPVPRERRRLDDWAPQHLAGTLRLSVRRRGRTLYQGTSRARRPRARPRAPRLVARRDRLHGPAVAVGVLEEHEPAPGEVLDLADVDAAARPGAPARPRCPRRPSAGPAPSPEACP